MKGPDSIVLMSKSLDFAINEPGSALESDCLEISFGEFVPTTLPSESLGFDGALYFTPLVGSSRGGEVTNFVGNERR